MTPLWSRLAPRLPRAADAIEFYRKAFDAADIGRLPGPGGKLLHALIRIGDSAVMLVDEFPERGSFGPRSMKGSPVTLHLYVENANAIFERAVAAGAQAVMPLADMFRGNRYGVRVDTRATSWKRYRT